MIDVLVILPDESTLLENFTAILTLANTSPKVIFLVEGSPLTS